MQRCEQNGPDSGTKNVVAKHQHEPYNNNNAVILVQEEGWAPPGYLARETATLAAQGVHEQSS